MIQAHRASRKLPDSFLQSNNSNINQTVPGNKSNHKLNEEHDGVTSRLIAQPPHIINAFATCACFLMMMIAFITFNSNLVPLFEGL